MAKQPETKVKPPSFLEKLWREWIIPLGISAALFFGFIRPFVVEGYAVPTGSMEDTIKPGDRLFGIKFYYGARIPFTDHRLPGLGEPRPGQIIIFKNPQNQKINYIKRCIAVENQTVEIRNKVVYVDGKKLDEPYVKHQDPRIIPRELDPRDNYGPVTVPKNCLFMMGDNRDNSLDSRYWGFLDKKLVLARAAIIFWSWVKEAKLPRLKRMGRILW